MEEIVQQFRQCGYQVHTLLMETGRWMAKATKLDAEVLLGAGETELEAVTDLLTAVERGQ